MGIWVAMLSFICMGIMILQLSLSVAYSHLLLRASFLAVAWMF